MSTLEEFNANMTVFYSKSSGKMQSACSGIQSMNMFGDSGDDYGIIWDFIVLPVDNYVIQNANKFKINLETKTLELLPVETSQYPTAQI